jgi:hypothetical protein
VAGQGKEDVVGDGAVEAQLADLDPRTVEAAHHLGQHRGATLDRDPDGMRLVIEDWVAGGQVAEQVVDLLEIALAIGDLRQPELDDLAADLSLELVLGALGDDLPGSMTAILSASRSASSRDWAVNRIVVPSATRSAMTSHVRPMTVRSALASRTTS